MKVAVVGANGQLGQDVCASFQTENHEVVALNHADIEISLLDSVRQVLERIRPDMDINTDYVFQGLKRTPYTEEDPAMPVNVYGNSKLAGEHFVRGINPRHFVVRVSAIYGQNPCRAKGGLNFVETMLKLSREQEELRV